LGAAINGHSQGRYLDDPDFEPVLDRAAALNVPIYLHPTIPPAAVIASSYAGFSAEVTFALATVGWGWHINTATHLLRLILGGVFDRHPELQIIIGHMGEATSFMLPRFDATLKPELTGLRHPVSTYLRQNVHYTFANFNDAATYANLVAQVGVGRPTTRSGRCGPHVRFWTSCRSATTIGRLSATATPRNCWAS
jgi:hypothetical protein